MPERRSFDELPFRDLLDEIAARTPAPAGGSVAALTATLAAALTEMAARFADGYWPAARDAAAAATVLRDHALPLVQADADAYAEVLRARRLPDGDPDRVDALGNAMEEAVAVPLEIARVAADVATLASSLAELGNPRLRADALAAATLAKSAARVAANLVATNLDGSGGDERLTEARRLAARAAAALDA